MSIIDSPSYVPVPRYQRSETRATYMGPYRVDQSEGAMALMGYGDQSDAGVIVNERTLLSASAVFGAVRNLGEDAGKLPIITYRRLNPDGKERYPEHPLYRILHDEPNPEMNPIEFKQALTSCAALYGAGYAEIERRNDGMPRYLWPIEPWRVNSLRDPGTKSLYYRVDGKTRIESRDMFRVLGFSMDGVLGEMIARVGRDSGGLTLAAQKFAGRFFGNGSRPSGILEFPAYMDEDKYQRFKKRFKAETSGEQAHSTPILEGGLKWTKTSTDPNEAQMLETRQFQVEDVARWFRMPPHKIGHLMRAAGWSTLEATNTDYVIDTLMPWFVKWEQEAGRKLIGENEREVFVEFLIDAMLRGDTQARAISNQTQFQNGAITLDEWRSQENRNPLPDGMGKKHFVQLNLTTIDKAINPPTPAAPVAGPSPDIAAVRSEVRSAIEELKKTVETQLSTNAADSEKGLRSEIRALEAKLDAATEKPPVIVNVEPTPPKEFEVTRDSEGLMTGIKWL